MGPRPELTNLNAAKDIIMEATQYGGDYEIQQISSERLHVRFMAKNKHYELAAEEKLKKMGYNIEKGDPNSHEVQTIYFHCEFPAEEIKKIKSEGTIEITDLRDEDEK